MVMCDVAREIAWPIVGRTRLRQARHIVWWPAQYNRQTIISLMKLGVLLVVIGNTLLRNLK